MNSLIYFRLNLVNPKDPLMRRMFFMSETLPQKLSSINCNRYNSKRQFSGQDAADVSKGIFYKISSSQPVAFFQESLVKAHDISGLPWWGTIILSTFVLRTCLTFPLSVYQAYIVAKVENITLLDMPEIAKDKRIEIAKKAREMKWTQKEASMNYQRAIKKEWDTLIVHHNCHPLKATLPLWFQFPTWICFSAALRNLAYMLPNRDAAAELSFLEMSVGGFLWIPNLVVPDVSWILPITLGISNLIIIEIQSLMRMRESTKAQKFATNFFRGFSIILIPISANVPACLCLYWSVSSIIALCQNLILMSNKVRFFCGIPDTPATLDRPYAQLAYEISQRFKFKK